MWSSPGAPTRLADEHLHQLQVFEAGQLLRDDAEGVSIQVPGGRNKVRRERNSACRDHRRPDDRLEVVTTSIQLADCVTR